ncbi:hypothetical protein H2199_006211 [Coniosporium tulheliwenetii]|uniref:Uncharacterized protein n=1 Tax=Coniosporium tulheliwenetii TaxID=3383036 RepID=A0ACC2YX98_9PEZI|nr:hypothetical protein H2199_006211 [Cladosporium sp. JES 115]
MSVIALVTSCVFFGILTGIHNPFEAGLLGYRDIGIVVDSTATSPTSEKTPSRPASLVSSNCSTSSPASSFYDLMSSASVSAASSPSAIGLGIFTSTSLVSLPSITKPAPTHSLFRSTPPPTIDSAWRAVHPPRSPPYGSGTEPYRNSTVRSAPPSPALLALAQRSSSSGAYRLRSVPPSVSSRSSSSGSLPKSPLSTMRRATAPDVVVVPEERRGGSARGYGGSHHGAEGGCGCRGTLRY